MQPEERDAAYLWDMLQAAKEIDQMIEHHDHAEFLENVMLQRATERCLEIVGETARCVSAAFKDAHPELPWRQIIGQRNILAHEYGQVDHDLLYKTAVEDVPELIVLIENLLPSLGEN